MVWQCLIIFFFDFGSLNCEECQKGNGRFLAMKILLFLMQQDIPRRTVALYNGKVSSSTFYFFLFLTCKSAIDETEIE